MQSAAQDDPSPDPLELLADCINRNDGPAWAAFLARYRPLIRQVFCAHAAAAHAEEFLDWFPGWLYGRRIHRVHLSCLRAQEDGRCQDPKAIREFLDNYLAACISKSAVGDFFREHPAPRGTPAALDLLSAAAEPSGEDV